MNIENPFNFYPGDYTLFYAVTLELMIRKLLDQDGYNQKLFMDNIDMTWALKGTGLHYPRNNVGQAIEFTAKALNFMGCRVRHRVSEADGDDEFALTLAVKLPKAMYLSSNNRDELNQQLEGGPFETYYDVKIGKQGTIFYVFYEEFEDDWRCLVNVVQGVIKLCKGGFLYGSSNNAA